MSAVPNMVYQKLAMLLQSIANCQNTHNKEWERKHEESVRQIVRDFMPSGSGWDEGTKIDMVESGPNMLYLYGSFHHMNEFGMYDGWTSHVIRVRPSLADGFYMTIGGQNRNDIKEHLHEMFDICLRDMIRQEKAEPFRYVKAEDPRAALRELVTRCDGPDGVRADGSNIDTLVAHAALGDL